MKIKLGDICKFQSGGTPSRANAEYFNGNIPWITTTVLSGGIINKESAVEWITNKAINDSAAKIVPANSIMVGTRVGVGKVAINAIDMSTSQDIISLINIDETKWNKEYLCKFIQGKSIYLNSQARGATIKGIKIDVLSGLELPEISIEEQYRVSRILDTVKKILDSRNIELQKLDNLVNARFVELFGDFIQRSNKVFLEEISDFVTVGIANSATHAYADSGIVMLRNQNIKENYLDENDLIYITPDFAKKYGSKQLAENDILVIRTGYPGVACLVPKKYKGCQTFTTLIVRLKDATQAHANYVCYYINSRFGKDYVEQSKVGVAQQNFGAKALAKMPIAVPPVELQKQFAAFVEQVAKSKVAVQKALDETQLLFDSLMQQYFG